VTADHPHAWRLESDLVLIESYRPAGEDTAFLDLPGVRVVGAVVIPGDEQVFYLVASGSTADVQRLVDAAGVDAIRIVSAAWASPVRANREG
jgi:hypothetical protein